MGVLGEVDEVGGVHLDGDLGGVAGEGGVEGGRSWVGEGSEGCGDC